MDFKEDIANALKTLREGGIILYPTDTIWGIGCDATNENAVAKIYKIKKRVDSKAMLSLVGADYQLQQYVKDIPDIAWQLIDVAVNPLTLIYEKPIGIADNLKAEDGSAGFRITHERFSRELCRQLRRPIVSTSANISGQEPPKTFHNISLEIRDAVDYMVEYGRDNESAIPSNIIKIGSAGEIKIIR